jgi:hypothetical protein
MRGAQIFILQTSRQDLAVKTLGMKDRPCRTTAGDEAASMENKVEATRI